MVVTVARRLFEQVAATDWLGDEFGEPAYAYVRVSSEEQAEEGASGLPRQLDRIGEKAGTLGFKVTSDRVFCDDGFSGYEYFRPGINKLLEELEAGRARANVLLVEDIDRLARDTDLQGFFFTLIAKRHRLRVVFWKDPGSKMERLFRGLMSDESMQQSKARMKEGTERKARSGRVTAKIPAFGYMFVDADGQPSEKARKETYYALHPEHSQTMRLVYDKVIYENWSLYRVCDHLAQLGIPAPRGDKFWDTAKLSSLLKRPLYKGEFIANQIRAAPTGRFNAKGRPIHALSERPESEWVRIPVPAVVTSDEWDLARSVLARHRKGSLRNGKKAQWLLSGLVKCACCGRSFRTGSGGSAAIEKRIRYYHCASLLTFAAERAEIGCTSSCVNADALERIIWNEVAGVLADPDRLAARLDERGEERADFYRDRIARIENDLAQTDRERERWDRAYGRALLALDDYEQKVKGVNARREELEQARRLAMAQLSERSKIATKKQAIRDRLATLTIDGISEQMPFERKRKLLELVVDEIRIDTGEKKAEIRGVLRSEVGLGQTSSREQLELTSGHRSQQKFVLDVPFIVERDIAQAFETAPKEQCGIEIHCKECGAPFRVHPSHVTRLTRCPRHRRYGHKPDMLCARPK